VLLEKLNNFSIARHNTVVPDDFKNIIKEFDYIDNKSETFRYAEEFKGEFWSDVIHLKKKMDWIAKSFSRINLANYNINQIGD
jgi:nitrous oxidase accessory protein NosD